LFDRVSVFLTTLDDGVVSAVDHQWETTFTESFNQQSLQIPWYAILGNHDYHGNPEAQIQYSHRAEGGQFKDADKRWKMPGHLYSVRHVVREDNNAWESIVTTGGKVNRQESNPTTASPIGQAPSNGVALSARPVTSADPSTADRAKSSELTMDIEIIFIDTSLVAVTDIGGIHYVSSERTDKYLADLEAMLAAAQNATWLFVAGHYTVFSYADHGNNAVLVRRLVPLLQKYGVQGYFNGHDHVLQHVCIGGISYFTSGHGTHANNFPLGAYDVHLHLPPTDSSGGGGGSGDSLGSRENGDVRASSSEPTPEAANVAVGAGTNVPTNLNSVSCSAGSISSAGASVAPSSATAAGSDIPAKGISSGIGIPGIGSESRTDTMSQPKVEAGYEGVDFQFGANGPGFAAATVSLDEFRLEFYDKHGSKLYATVLPNSRRRTSSSPSSSLSLSLSPSQSRPMEMRASISQTTGSVKLVQNMLTLIQVVACVLVVGAPLALLVWFVFGGTNKTFGSVVLKPLFLAACYSVKRNVAVGFSAVLVFIVVIILYKNKS
jgi:hypothetical protein